MDSLYIYNKNRLFSDVTYWILHITQLAQQAYLEDPNEVRLVYLLPQLFNLYRNVIQLQMFGF